MIEELNEVGELRKMLADFPVSETNKPNCSEL